MEVGDLALHNGKRHALHGLGDVVEQPVPLLRREQPEKVAGLRVIVVAVAVIVAVRIA